jgi:hypothetical protein
MADNESIRLFNKQLRAYATETLHRWLTKEERAESTREYVQEGAQLILSGRVKLTESSKFGTDPNLSESAQSAVAMRLARSFGEEGNCYGDLETWPEVAAYGLGNMVDYFALADKLLRQYVPEYVPGEVRDTGKEDSHE